MTPYPDDRAYTNYIHDHIAVPKIYRLLNWEQVKLEQELAYEIDILQGIDYVFRDSSGAIKTVQERFRESKFHNYSDFTIRYRRDDNSHSDRRESEYFKMKADYFTYGITNGSKLKLNECTGFIKFAIIDLRRVYEKIDNGLILILDNGKNTCFMSNNKLICPVKYNKGGSSSFLPIDISYLVRLWGNEIIIYQKGFL